MLLVLGAHAAPNKDWYVGVGFLSGSGERTIVSSTTDYDTSGADIKFGVIFKTNNRLEFSASSIDLKSTTSTLEVKGRELDWIFTANLNNQESIFLPFISVGFGRFTIENASSTGISAQAALGGYFRLKEDFEIEVSYKEKAISWSDSTGFIDAQERMTNYYVGLKYKF